MIQKKGNPVGGMIFIVLISIFAIVLLIGGYVAYTVSTELKPLIGVSQEVNDSLDTTTNIATTTLNTLWYIFFAGLLLGLIVQGMMAPQYPKVLFPIFILTLIVSIIVAVALSNTYEALADSVQLNSASLYQQGIYLVMTNLPIIALIVGLVSIGIIFTRDSSVGGSGGIVN